MLELKVIKTFTPHRSWANGRVGGNSKRPTFAVCPVCRCIFGPLPNLSRRFCSMECKAISQSTGMQRIHRPTRAARKAQSLIRYHVDAGNIQRPKTCEECGATGRIEAAHFNYDEPLRVRWLCCSCHRRWDKREPKNGTFVMAGRGFVDLSMKIEQLTGRKAEQLLVKETLPASIASNADLTSESVTACSEFGSMTETTPTEAGAVAEVQV